MSKRIPYKGFYIHLQESVTPYYLIIREGEWDWDQIPFVSVEAARVCIDTMIETGKEAFYEDGEIVYLAEGETYGDDADGACAEA